MGAQDPSTRLTSATAIGEGTDGARQLSVWTIGRGDGVGVSCGDAVP
jgi:hypothetical protein